MYIQHVFLTCMHIAHNPDHSSRAWGFPKWSVQNENEGLKRSLRWTSHKIVCRLWYLLTCRLQYLGLVGWYFHPSTKQGTPELNTRIEANSLGVCIPKGQILDDIHPNLSPNPSKTPLRISAFADLSEHNGNPCDPADDPRPGGLGDRRLALRPSLQETQRPSAGHQRSAARGGAGSRTLFIRLFGMGFSSGLMVV